MQPADDTWPRTQPEAPRCSAQSHFHRFKASEIFSCHYCRKSPPSSLLKVKKGLISHSQYSRCRLHSFTTSDGPEQRHNLTASTPPTRQLCNLCIPVVCDKLCQHITLVKHFSCIIHPRAYIPHGHFQIPLKLIPPS